MPVEPNIVEAQSFLTSVKYGSYYPMLAVTSTSPSTVKKNHKIVQSDGMLSKNIRFLENVPFFALIHNLRTFSTCVLLLH